VVTGDGVTVPVREFVVEGCAVTGVAGDTGDDDTESESKT
jgi:hypothetical protein